MSDKRQREDFFRTTSFLKRLETSTDPRHESGRLTDVVVVVVVVVIFESFTLTFLILHVPRTIMDFYHKASGKRASGDTVLTM